MASTQARFGADLRLLVDLGGIKSNRDVGHDLAVGVRPPSAASGEVDLATYSGADTLIQALLLRLITERGELTVLGHPDYGSRLASLVGEPLTETTRHRAKLYVLEALAMEPRVKQVLAVNVAQHPADRTRIDIDVTLQAITGDTPINLVFPFFLEGGAAA